MAVSNDELHVIVVGAGISGLLLCQGLKKLGIRYTIVEKDISLNCRSNEWTMAIHWALPLLSDVLPDELWTKLPELACNPQLGIHSGLYPIIQGETGDLITGVPYQNGLRVPRSRMRTLCAEGLDVQYGKYFVNAIFHENSRGITAVFADGSEINGSMLIGAEGGRSRVREIAIGNAENAAPQKFPICHTNMTVCYGDAEKARYVRARYPTSYLALSQQSFHAFQSISSMPDGPEHPETWTFHMAMAWLGPNDKSLSNSERLALIKEKAETLGEPAYSAFMWIPEDTLVHQADISYWVTRPWNNKAGRITLLGDAAHPMPPYRGQGLNHCICDVSKMLQGLRGVAEGTSSFAEAVSTYEVEMIPRGADEVESCVENGKLLHDWARIQESPVFKIGFKAMEGKATGATITPAMA